MTALDYLICAYARSSQLPACIGFFVGLILGCTGLGAVILTRFGTRSFDDGKAASQAVRDDVGSVPALAELPSIPASSTGSDGVVTAADEAPQDDETPVG